MSVQCVRNRLLVYETSISPPKSPISIEGREGSTFIDAAFHPTGRYFAATTNDGMVTLYDPTSWESTATYSWNIGRLRSVAFSPDGTLAAVGSNTGKIVVWDVDF